MPASSFNISRRTLLRGMASAATGSLLLPAVNASGLVSMRPFPGARNFRSRAVDAAIERVSAFIPDPELAWIFSNCLPNTLDTTANYSLLSGFPDTVIVTGDIPAMWLRDSSAQVWPYLDFLRQDADLALLIQGLIRRQVQCILIDPYANAFMPDLKSNVPLVWSKNDRTTLLPGVAERKWEVDSLCYPVRLAHRYWKQTGDLGPFNAPWRQAMHLVVATFKEQQRKNGPGPYAFARTSPNPYNSLSEAGHGNPTRPIGLIHSGFRPSDDSCIYSFNIPANFFAVQTLLRIEEMQSEIAKDHTAAREAAQLALEVKQSLEINARREHPSAGVIWAYELDGFGNALFMDDANVPSLLSMPYLGSTTLSNSTYMATRRFALSDANPYF